MDASTWHPRNLRRQGSIYGMITLDGIDYIERHQVFVADIQIDSLLQVKTNQRLTLPGVANFLLKGLTRDVTLPSPPNLPGQFPSSVERIFRFRIVNSEGTSWFMTAGLGIFDDRVVDSLCFGSGQFPFPVIPPVPVHATGSLIYEIEDTILSTPGPIPNPIPYIIHLGFHGSYLFPVEEVGTKGPLAFAGTTGHGIVRTV